MSKKLIAGCCLASALISAAVGLAFTTHEKTVVGGLPDFTALIEKDGPGVVNIRTLQRTKPIQTGTAAELKDLLHSFFAPPLVIKDEEDRGIGSGFFISKEGYLLTNAHVVDGATDVIVTLTDHREYSAKILGYDLRTDVALLKVDADEDLPYIPVGDSNNLKVGAWVFAIGSPFNLENTATAGIISATARDAGEYLPLIQSDVSINPGNSGGPLMDMHGKVIGINSQILQSTTGGAAGISFAVPIVEAMEIAEQLKAHGKVVRGRLGITVGEPAGNIRIFFGKVGARVVVVQGVEEGGPAEKAGVVVGDIITKFNGLPVDGLSDLPWRVGGAKVGEYVNMSVIRNNKEMTLKVKIEPLDENKIQQSLDVDLT